MAKQKTVTLPTGLEVKLQSVSPTWYYDTNDRFGTTGGGGRKQSARYMDEMFKNCVVEPRELATEGMKFFDNADDLSGAEQLIREIESFLRGRN